MKPDISSYKNQIIAMQMTIDAYGRRWYKTRPKAK